MNTSIAYRGQRKAIDCHKSGVKEVESCNVEATTPMMTKWCKVGSAHQLTQYSTTNGTEEEELEFSMFHDDTYVKSENVDFGEINTWIHENGNEYVQFADENLYLFTKYEHNAIDLLVRLCKTKASLKTYESIKKCLLPAVWWPTFTSEWA